MQDRRSQLFKRWSDDKNFYKMVADRDVSTDPNATEVISQIAHLTKLLPSHRALGVEIGSGDGKLLSLITAKGMFDEVIGSDIAGHRLDTARQQLSGSFGSTRPMRSRWPKPTQARMWSSLPWTFWAI